MATVVVTGAGGACGSSAIESLTAGTDHRIIGVDMDASAAGIQLADSGTAVPPATDDSWPSAMADVVDRFDADVILPTVDEELAELPSLSGLLPDTPIVAPRQAVIELAMDKYRTMKRLSAAGHPTPETWLATDAAEIDPAAYPLIVKPRRGRGSRGVQQVQDPTSLSAHLDATDYRPDELLCQEYIGGTEYTTSVVGTTDNTLLSVVPKEAIEKDGSTVLGATRQTPAVTEACTALFETLEPAGPINVQQIIDEDGTPRLIEINPRFSSTSCLTVAAGVDVFDLLIRDALGETVAHPTGFEADRYICRYQSQLFPTEEELSELGGRRGESDAAARR